MWRQVVETFFPKSNIGATENTKWYGKWSNVTDRERDTSARTKCEESRFDLVLMQLRSIIIITVPYVESQVYDAPICINVSQSVRQRFQWRKFVSSSTAASNLDARTMHITFFSIKIVMNKIAFVVWRQLLRRAPIIRRRRWIIKNIYLLFVLNLCQRKDVCFCRVSFFLWRLRCLSSSLSPFRWQKTRDEFVPILIAKMFTTNYCSCATHVWYIKKTQ